MNTNTPLAQRTPNSNVFFNSVLQLIFSSFRNNCYTSPFYSSTEGSLLKCLFQTARNACNSKDVDALIFQLVHHDTFYNGQNKQNITECLLVLIYIVNKDQVQQLILRGLLYLTSCFHLCWKNILSAIYVD